MHALSPSQGADLQSVVTLARQNRAPLSRLVEAYELASAGGLVGTATELRGHIHKMIPAPAGHTELKDITLGVVAGIITQFLIRRYY